MGVFDQVTASPTDRWSHSSNTSAPSMVPPSPALTGVGGGHDLDPHQLAANGVVLLGRVLGIEEGVVSIASDLRHSLRDGDAGYLGWRERIENYIQASRLVAPDDPPITVYAPSPAETSPLEVLDLAANGVSGVVWATGFQTEFSWIHVPVFDAAGHPLHYRGVASVPGLYFMRMAPFYKRRATLIDGLEEDAGYVAEHIRGRSALGIAAD
jgi:putative flavoprotein involved in K+ transport